MSREIRCVVCNNLVTDESSPCPVCGDSRRSISVEAQNAFRLMQELGTQTLDAEARVRREYQSRTDGTKEGIIDRDLSGEEEVIHRLGTRSEPIVNFYGALLRDREEGEGRLRIPRSLANRSYPPGRLA
jgi:hypothetical protein